MSILSEEFESKGFLQIPDILDKDGLSNVEARLTESSSTVAGNRRLLDHDWCRQLAACVREVLVSRKLIGGNYVAILCTYFEKSAETNWGVAPHKDLSIPVRNKFELGGWNNWNDKQGIPHVQPPKAFLLSLFSVRINIDQSSEDNGALIVSPESHKRDTTDGPFVHVCGAPGSALMMSPLIVHASRKSVSGSNRRVLHFLFGPAEPAPPVQWFYTA